MKSRVLASGHILIWIYSYSIVAVCCVIKFHKFDNIEMEDERWMDHGNVKCQSTEIVVFHK